MTSRFRNYARWDLTINRGLYRSGAITVAALFVAITLINFLQRYAQVSLAGNMGSPSGAVSWLTTVTKWTFAIAAGYMFHNMLERKNRIQELTIPATACEKFGWHALVLMGGSLVCCLGSLVLSDALQALLTLIFVDAASVQSLTVAFFGNTPLADTLGQLEMSVNMSVPGTQLDGMEAPAMVLATAQRIMDWHLLYMVASCICFSGIFAYVNSIRYKSNIVHTIVLLVLVTLACVVISSVALVSWAMANSDAFLQFLAQHLFAWVNIWYAFMVVLGAGGWWGAYRRFTHAQLITRTNP